MNASSSTKNNSNRRDRYGLWMVLIIAISSPYISSISHLLTGRYRLDCTLLAGFSCTLDVQLQCTCKIGDISHDFNIIQCFKIINPQRIRIPDLGIDRPGLVLQNHIFIWFSVFFLSRCLFMFTKVNSGHPASLKKFLNKFHIISFRLSA